MIAEATQFHTTQYTAQYELLRSEVLGAKGYAVQTGAAGRTRAVGLALLLCEGMPGWLKAVETVLRTSMAPPTRNTEESSLASEPLSRYESVPAWLSGVPRHDLTAFLASLVLSTRHLENSSSREGYRPCR